MEHITVECPILVNASREQVWLAVTEAEQLSVWYAPGSPWDIPKLEAGAAIYFHHSPNSYHAGTEVITLQATIEAIDPKRRFALRWELDFVGEPMVTTFLLEEEDGGTRLVLTESGYESREQARPTEEGYTMSLKNLKAHLEGRELPY
ncbi:SRPBCC domain-containing protein [Paenibacillus sp. PL91]|uniref:SRPBCC domain-containing protein n=1 Tax=Paenibacillus sp. PL91 TaxID=2729538 RepID=UPI00145D7621|nr:SRPBCC domain-containing protein [Paenibacillus sp. PL91]MBC9202121.1 SRPBCC domain-containing protein [Paenibacillus sp. PL91]